MDSAICTVRNSILPIELNEIKEKSNISCNICSKKGRKILHIWNMRPQRTVNVFI